MKHFCTLSFLFLLCATCPLKAQDRKAELALLYYNSGSSVILRWAPLQQQTFAKGLKYGYRVVRKTMVRDGAVLPVEARVEQEIGGAIIFPYQEPQLGALAEQEPKAAMLYEALYGESTKKEAGPVNPFLLLQRKREAELIFGLTLYACDLSPQTAKAAGLYAIDDRLLPNERYLYMLSLAQEATDTVTCFVVPGDTTILPKPLDIRVHFGDREAMLEWNTLLFEGVYSAYMAERSTDGKNFQPVCKEPVATVNQEGNPTTVASYKDSLPQNGTTYYYRLRGFSPFGVYGAPSDVVQGQGEKTFTAFPIIDTAFADTKQNVTLKWHELGDISMVKGYSVERAVHPDSVYAPLHKGLLSTKTAQFVHKKVLKGGYYRVVAVAYDEKWRQPSLHFYMHIPDEVPPTAPTGLSGSVDTAGIVRLQWAPNPEADVAGYRVFAANAPNALYVDQCDNTLLQPFFTDTLPLSTLSSAIYYKVLAIDYSYNYSPHSAPLKLSKPDTIPPTAPRITDVEQKGNGLLLHLTPSYSTDVADYRLYYSLTPDDSLRLLHQWNANAFPQTYILTGLPDTLVEVFLWVFATDIAKNRSRSQSYEVKILRKEKPCTIEMKHKLADNQVRLTWQTPSCEVKQYRLYRGAGNTPATLLLTFPPDALEYVDKEITYGLNYHYILQAVSPQIKKAAEVKVVW